MLLASFCAPGPQGNQLARLDFDSELLQWLDGVPPDARAMGLLAVDDGFIVLYSGGSDDAGSGVLRLDPALRVVAARPLRVVREAHSLIAAGEAYLAISSATDALVAIHWPRDGAVSEEVAWRFADGRHQVHVNSVARFDGRVFVTMFGPSYSSRWFEARDGAVWDTTNDVEVFSGLVHPHSLFQLEDRLCVLESYTGRVLDVTDGRPCELFQVPGYTRGACVHGDSLYVGTSYLRLRSLRGVEERPRSTIDSRCAIYRVDIRSGEMQMRDLYRDAREIYDLCVI